MEHLLFKKREWQEDLRYLQKTVNKNGEGIEVLDIQNKITVFDYDQTVISYKRLRNESSNPKGAVEITYKFHLEHIEKVEVKAYQLEGVEEKLWQVVLLTKDKHKLVLLNGYLNVSLVPFTVDNEAAALSIQQAFEEVLTMVHAL